MRLDVFLKACLIVVSTCIFSHCAKQETFVLRQITGIFAYLNALKAMGAQMPPEAAMMTTIRDDFSKSINTNRQT